MRFLFDRICGSERPILEDATGVDRITRVRESIKVELDRIMSQKQYFLGMRQDDTERQLSTVLDYGVSRGVGLLVHAGLLDGLSKQIQAAITAFEPRLIKPQVDFAPARSGPGTPIFLVTGRFKVEEGLFGFKEPLAPWSDG
jgi:predicted component of type VI protein secretion system